MKNQISQISQMDRMMNLEIQSGDFPLEFFLQEMDFKGILPYDDSEDGLSQEEYDLILPYLEESKKKYQMEMEKYSKMIS